MRPFGSVACPLNGMEVAMHSSLGGRMTIVRSLMRWVSFAMLLVALGLWGVVQVSAATVYYIDYVGGNGTNVGTSPSSPWRHCPGDTQATLNAAAAELAPGDRLVFKGGVRYKGSIRICWSGDTAAPITYDGNADGTWGDGPAIITSESEVDGENSWKAMWGGSGISNIVIRGINFADIGGYAENDPIWQTTNAVSAPPDGFGIWFYDGGVTHLTIEDCVFERIGQWINAIPMSGVNSINGSGITLRGVRYATIRNCKFTKMRIGVSLKVSPLSGGCIGPVDISGCDFYDHIVWGIDVAPQQDGMLLTDIMIERCNFYNYSQYDAGNWLGYGEKPHRDGIFLRNAGKNAIWSNMVVRSCKFWDDNPQKSRGGTGSIYISEGPSVQIYNCVFLSDPQALATIGIGWASPPGVPQSILIANNTFIADCCPINIAATTSPAELIIKNNLFYRRTNRRTASAMNMLSTNVSLLVSDYNLYHADQPDSAWYAIQIDNAFLMFDNWRSAGYEANGMASDPSLSSINGPPSSWNIRPIPGSPLVGTGADLSTLFDADINGTPRRGPWTIGAVHVDSQRLLPPGNLRRTSQP